MNIVRYVPAIMMVAGVAAAQENQRLVLEPGVSSHKEIDEIYHTFSKAYDLLDPEQVSSLYGEQALYLAPGEPVRKGRSAILESFKRFFDWARDRKRKLKIGFQIVERGVSDALVYDVGLYRLKGTGGGMADSEDVGKFVVVARKDQSGRWFFQVDAYSGMSGQ